jgi:hypothetical protein
MRILILLAPLALLSNSCSSVFYSILPRHGISEKQILAIETGKTQYAEIAGKLGSPSRIGHKSNGHTIRIYRYISPYPGSYSALMIETDQREIITDYEYYRTNDDDLGANQGYGRNHVFTTRE